MAAESAHIDFMFFGAPSTRPLDPLLNWFSVLYYIRLHMCVRNTYNFIKNNSPVQINKYRITDMFIKSDWLFGRLFTLKVIFVIYEMLNKIQDACL